MPQKIENPEQVYYEKICSLVKQYHLRWAPVKEDKISYSFRIDGKTTKKEMDNWSNVDNYKLLVDWLRTSHPQWRGE